MHRDRRKQIPDPYNLSKTTAGPWSDVDTIDLDEAFIASSSSDAVPDATRLELLTLKSLYCPDPSVDVMFGDRIRAGAKVYYVAADTTADVNPFTGWQPAKEIPLKNTEG